MGTPTRPVFPEGLAPDLQQIADSLVAAIEARRGDAAALLAVLRFLEDCHQWLRDGLYQEALPSNRQALFELLWQMEQQRLWPNIPRAQWLALLERVRAELAPPDGSTSEIPPSG
jgi:hypothetical protein